MRGSDHRVYPVATCFHGPSERGRHAREPASAAGIAARARPDGENTELVLDQPQANGRFDEQQAILSRRSQRRPAATVLRIAGAAQPLPRDAGAADRAQPRGSGRSWPAAADPRAPAYGQGFESQPVRPRAPEFRGAYDQPYQSIARDIERVRKEEDGVAAFGKIAGELKGLREELRHQMASSLRREFDTLRKDFQRATRRAARRRARSGSTSSGCRAPSSRSANAPTTRASPCSAGARADEGRARPAGARRDGALRRSPLGRLRPALQRFRAPHFGRRRTRRKQRRACGADRPRRSRSARPWAICPNRCRCARSRKRCARLPARSTISSSSRAAAPPQTFAQIEERLDEISRAIVGADRRRPAAACRSRAVRADRGAHLRARPADRGSRRGPPGREVMEHLQVLSRRVDELAARAAMPDEAIERLAYQIAVIADKIDHAPAVPDVSEIFSGIEQRFDVLSNLFERRQGDALEQGNMLFRELERRLDDVAEKFDQRQADAALDGAAIMKAIDAALLRLRARRWTAAGAAVPATRRSAAWRRGSRTSPSASTSRPASSPASIRTWCAVWKPRSPGFRRISPSPARRCRNSTTSRRGSRRSRSRSPTAASRCMEAARQAAESAARSLAGSQPERRSLGPCRRSQGAGRR